MAVNIVIRAEFLVEDLKARLFVDNDFHPMIAKAWKEDIRYIIQNGIECKNEQIYDFKNKEDLKECIDMGLDAEVLHILSINAVMIKIIHNFLPIAIHSRCMVCIFFQRLM